MKKFSTKFDDLGLSYNEELMLFQQGDNEC